MEKLLMLGNEAVARAAYEAGAAVASAYPGTPSTEITEYIAKYERIYCEWAPNEKVALETAIGAAIAGARSICSMKHVGLNVAADPLFTAAYTGVNGGLVIMVADDPGMHSSQNEQDSRYYALAANVPMLEPADSQECLDYVKEAFRISEAYDTPVIVRLTTRVAHSRSLVTLSEREDREPLEYRKDAGKYVMMPAMARARHVEVERRLGALREFAETAPYNSVSVPSLPGVSVPSSPGVSAPNAAGKHKLGVITAGIASLYTREALVSLEASGPIPVLKLGLVYPLPKRLIADFASRVETLIVAEELASFIENHVKTLGLDVKVIGKDLLPTVGELSAALIRGALCKADGERLRAIISGALEKAFSEWSTDGEEDNAVQVSDVISANVEQLPARPPVLCPGCPHRGVFYVLKRLKLTVCGDIGCYTLGALPPLEAMDTCVCMGASISVAHGMNKARGAEFAQKTVAVIGDSTFLHSGITSLLDVVYNRGDTTVLILDNSITGMTGHQENPSTGRTIRGDYTYKVDLETLCKALGVPSVRVEDPFDVAALEAAIKEETARRGPSVIIVRRPCALIRSYEPKEAVMIDPGKCTHCRMCMGISCAAISDKDGKMEINAALCAKCGLCSKICRFGAINPVDI